MGLTSWSLVAVCGLMAAALPIAALWAWGRVRGPAPVRMLQRIGMIVGCQATAVLCAAVLINKSYYFYASWDDLLGSHTGGSVAADSPSTVAGRVAQSFAEPSVHRKGALIRSELHGPASGVTARVLVYLPPEYGDPGYAATRFPVVELLPGYPGTPTTWVHKLHVVDTLEAEVRARRAAPFVLVLPEMNLDGPRDLECSDVVGGPKVETWLSQDVHQLVQRDYRVRNDAHGWGTMGYSTGAYCAAKLAVRHPDLFHAGVSLSGYFNVARGPYLQELYGGNTQLAQQNSPDWLVANRPEPDVALLLTASAQDGPTVATAHTFASLARPPLRISELVARNGGHNTGVWAAQVGSCLDWLSTQLRTPGRTG